MPTARTYGEACGIPRALDRVGERWALLVVRELLLGPKRFTDLKTGLPAASPNVLAQRLRELEQAGIVRKRRLPPPAASQVYELTEWGAELEPVLVALGRWGARAPLDPEYMGMSIDSHIVSLATLFDGELAGDLEASLELRMGDDVFHAVVCAHSPASHSSRQLPSFFDASACCNRGKSSASFPSDCQGGFTMSRPEPFKPVGESVWRTYSSLTSILRTPATTSAL